MSDIDADMDRLGSRVAPTVTRGQVAKAVLALARNRSDIPWLASALGYDEERTYRTAVLGSHMTDAGVMRG